MSRERAADQGRTGGAGRVVHALVRCAVVGLVVCTGCIWVRYADEFYGTLSVVWEGSSSPEPLLPLCPGEARLRNEADLQAVRIDQWGADPYASCPAARDCTDAACTEAVCTAAGQPIITPWHLDWWSTPYGVPPVQLAWLRLERRTLTTRTYWLYHRHALALWDARCLHDPALPCTGFVLDDTTLSYGTWVPATGAGCFNSWALYLECEPLVVPDAPCTIPYSSL